ncbi:MAG TPA: hypothetical protein GX525_01475 [Bacilli bacterium]|nr:hypothetical protein [Bacilli bacterium]
MKNFKKTFSLIILSFIFSGCTSTSTSGTADFQKISTEASQEETSSSQYEGQVVENSEKTSDYLSFNKIIDTNGNEYSPPDDIKKLVGNYQFIKETDLGDRVRFFLTIHEDGSFISNLVTDIKTDAHSISEKAFYFDKTNELHQSQYSEPKSTLETGVIIKAYGNYYFQPLEELQLPLAYDQEGNLIINYLNSQLYYERAAHNGVQRELEDVRKDFDDTINISDNSITVTIRKISHIDDISDNGGEKDNTPLTKIDEQNEFAKRSVFQVEKYLQKNKTKFQKIKSLNGLLIVSNYSQSSIISAVNPESLEGYTVDNKQPKLNYAIAEDISGTIYYTATDGENLYEGVNDTEPIEWESTPLFE